MVPGVFKHVIPCLIARPLRGLTWASNPWGNSIKSPVGISALSSGFNSTVSVKLALMSIPAAPAVSYAGNGLDDRLIIFTCIFSTPANVSNQISLAPKGSPELYRFNKPYTEIIIHTTAAKPAMDEHNTYLFSSNTDA